MVGSKSDIEPLNLEQMGLTQAFVVLADGEIF
jgi:hypothetical protein